MLTGDPCAVYNIACAPRNIPAYLFVIPPTPTGRAGGSGVVMGATGGGGGSTGGGGGGGGPASCVVA